MPTSAPRQNADRSFTDKVLGASATPDTGKPVNADAEVPRRKRPPRKPKKRRRLV